MMANKASVISPYLSIQKAFRVLEHLAERSPQGVKEVASALGLEQSSTSRLLKGLADLGYLVPSDRRGQYDVSPRVLLLAQRYLQGDRLVQEAQAVLRELALAARATAHLGIVVDRQMLVVAKEPSPEFVQVDTRVGSRIAPHASAIGKVLLASLSAPVLDHFLAEAPRRFTDKTIVDRRKLLKIVKTVRETGYALEEEGEHPGVGCIGAPVRDGAGRWIAALSISGPLQGTPFKVDQAHIKMLLVKAADLSRRMVSTKGQPLAQATPKDSD